MKNLPMDLLRSFVTVSQLGGFTQAGELLGRSQPAISLQIKRLEEMVDQPLFIRNGLSIELSSSGQLMLQYAKRILAINDEAIAKFSKATLSGTVRLGIPSEFATTLLPTIVSRFIEAYPNVTLEVTCALSKHMLTGTEKNQYDLILALHDNPQEAGEDLVKTDQLVWVSSNQHDPHLQSIIPLIVAPEGCIYRSRGIKLLDQKSQPWSVVYTIQDLTGLMAAIQEGLGVTVLTKSTVPSDLKIVRPSEKFPNLGTIGISLLKPRHENTEAVERLSDYLRASLT